MRRTPARLALALALAPSVVAAGCSSGGQEQATASTTTSLSAPARSTTVTTAACPGGPVAPEGATGVTEAGADLDGDGAGDRMVAARLDAGGRTLAVELSSGGTAAAELGSSEPGGPSPLSVLGGADLGGDGETAFAVTGAGASVLVVQLFQLAGCDLVAVTDESGQVVDLPVGGGVTHGDGFTCGDGALVVSDADSTDGETFRASRTTYRIEGTTLVQTAAETTTLRRDADDEAIAAAYRIDCPALDRAP